MELQNVYIQLGILFLLLIFGYLLGKLQVITEEGTQEFSSFVIKVCMPALMISGMLIPATPEKLYRGMLLLGVATVSYALAVIVGTITAHFLTKDKAKKGIYSYVITFSNCGFMGIPVLQAIFGKEIIFYVVIHNIIFNVLVYTLGVKLLSGHLEGKKAFKLNALINPGTVASIVGLILFMLNLPLPRFVTGAVDAVGGLCTPLSMIVIGAMLSELPLSQMFNNNKAYILVAIRLIILPLLTLILIKYILRVEDLFLLSIPVIIAGMPVATNAGLMAKEYGSDALLASQLIFISTLFSCISIPLLTRII
ncbi:malate permease [Sporanaerobium hydrogeniformans]|uniref:Malate permease n=1 Tax=Sporanaerobium hydrogeniformans TaxID=3072179 RepID=A0AC61DAM4_9FIRM|nr:AEC family transporter [Sporanaerobium hydrogeniformans]PHV69820.1 malate permease [Sporanaerobium hydrogeniformans]